MEKTATKNKGFYERRVKRPLDFFLALIGLIVLSPVLLLITILIRRKLGKPVIFTQERPGLNEKVFKMYKFRSMTDARDKNGNLLPDMDRITPFGKFLRSTSLDELPELLNVLKGEMSLVGPRPLLVEYLPFYTEAEKLRHSIRPGITGLAQVNGRNNLKWDKRLETDVIYVQNISFLHDLKILFLTLKNVVFKKDIVVVPAGKGQKLNVVRANFVLKELNESDLPYRIAWINDPKVYKTMNIQTPITKEKTLSWYKNAKNNKKRMDFTLFRNELPVGMAGLVNVNNSKAEQYTFIAPEEQGKGWGTILHFLWLIYGFKKLNLKEIVSIIDEDNLPSRKTVEKLGFTLTKIEKNGLQKDGKSINRYHYVCTPNTFNSKLLNYQIQNGHITHVS